MMNNGRPKIKSDEMYQLLREQRIDEFNARRARGESCDLTEADFRGLDLRELHVEGLDFSNSSFRLADLRGLNLSSCRLEGASIKGAHISGAYFPKEICPDEILLSLMHGTCMRYRVEHISPLE